MRHFSKAIISAILFVHYGCSEKKAKSQFKETEEQAAKAVVIFDTDANNELDDQHALAYLLFNADVFNIGAITVNATYNGGAIESHYREAERVLKLGAADGIIPLLAGANKNFKGITAAWDPVEYDGHDAVDYLLDRTKKDNCTIIAVGKLTNIALALKKDPSFADRTRIVWLGSNYPEPGEYNQDNDTIAMNYVLNSKIPFEMVTVRYGKPSGTDAVRVTQSEILSKMPGLGPVLQEPVEGRHGGSFTNFGDYSVNLFEHIDYHGDPPSRALFDMVAVALLKQPGWGEKRIIPAPILIDNVWVERPSNPRNMVIWENFNKDEILKDFYDSMQDPKLVTPSR